MYNSIYSLNFVGISSKRDAALRISQKKAFQEINPENRISHGFSRKRLKCFKEAVLSFVNSSLLKISPKTIVRKLYLTPKPSLLIILHALTGILLQTHCFTWSVCRGASDTTNYKFQWISQRQKAVHRAKANAAHEKYDLNKHLVVFDKTYSFESAVFYLMKTLSEYTAQIDYFYCADFGLKRL